MSLGLKMVECVKRHWLLISNWLPGIFLGPSTHQLCDLRQVALSVCASVSPPGKQALICLQSHAGILNLCFHMCDSPYASVSDHWREITREYFLKSQWCQHPNMAKVWKLVHDSTSASLSPFHLHPGASPAWCLPVSLLPSFKLFVPYTEWTF